jgi:hypothetical protein
MTAILLILIALVLPAVLLYLTVSTNEFEKSTRALATFIQKRYVYVPPRKAVESKAMQSLSKQPGKP